jgi:hypothetical protein
MPPLSDDQEALTFLLVFRTREFSRYFLIIQWRPSNLEIDFLRRPPNDADWEGGMVIIQKVG